MKMIVGWGVCMSDREYTSSFASKLFAVRYVMFGTIRYGAAILDERPCPNATDVDTAIRQSVRKSSRNDGFIVTSNLCSGKRADCMPIRGWVQAGRERNAKDYACPPRSQMM